ncbi:phosphohistidine phosphatase SixA [Microcoleus sp. LEGE 07076]|uniref:phosphohistidine phosphatase SixA n=1 Tax=Microcoleus sp. LEGE 07076 TaxID=915322 RepID=UPI001880D669|nr:phosphohistidine phosphatase SixA [Microcoleus sp. LEGE 07076]
MHLYLFRHGIAAEPEEYETDSERPLTKQGDRKTRKIAQRLYDLEIQFDLILASPLLRAQQTAQILLSVGLSAKITESAALAPSGDIGDWLKWYKQWQETGSRSLVLVGHQPDLGNWAETLLWGRSQDALILKKAGIIGLILPETGSPVGRSQMFWLTGPKFLLG